MATFTRKRRTTAPAAGAGTNPPSTAAAAADGTAAASSTTATTTAATASTTVTTASGATFYKRPRPQAEPQLDGSKRVFVQFRSADGDTTGPQMDLPLDITQEQLESLINSLLENEEPLPYSFFISQCEVVEDLLAAVTTSGSSVENVLAIEYRPQAAFRVRAVARCGGDLSGHTEAVLCVAFSPDSQMLASGSGDTTVRVWDIMTNTPRHECKGHTNWVLCVAWSPDAELLASGSMDNDVRVWRRDGTLAAHCRGHTRYVTAIAWQPLHCCDPTTPPLVASASKDCTVRLWEAATGQCVWVCSGHTAAITALRFTGDGLLLTASQDRTVRVYSVSERKLVRVLEGHAHWINTMALSTDYVMRCGPFDPPTGTTFYAGAAAEAAASSSSNELNTADPVEMRRRAQSRYNAARGNRPERLVTGSDDFTLLLWEPSLSKKPIARLTGHQQLVNCVAFSPDGRLLISASFDKSLKLWDATSGAFLATFRGHVGAVYMAAWSGDGRMVVSASKDSTLKVWEVRTRRMREELPGHADEVYAVDWSGDGERVASGSKDTLLKIWRA